MSARQVIRRAMDRRRSAAHGGCFAPEPDPNAPDACCDGTCACARTLDRDADAILAALREAGLVVVPVEPTEKMLTLGQRAFARKMYDATSPAPTEHPYDGGGALGYAYRAMIAAAKEDSTDA